MCDVDPIVAERRALVRFQFNIETICSKYSSISKEKWNEEDDVIVDLRNLKISGKVPLNTLNVRSLGKQMNLVCLKPKIHKRHYKERAEEFAKYIEEIGQTDLFEDTGESGFADDLQSVVSCNTCVSTCARSYEDCLKAAKEALQVLSTPSKLKKVPASFRAIGSAESKQRRIPFRSIENGSESSKDADKSMALCKVEFSTMPTLSKERTCGDEDSCISITKLKSDESIERNADIFLRANVTFGTPSAFIGLQNLTREKIDTFPPHLVSQQRAKRPRLNEDFVWKELLLHSHQMYCIDEYSRLFYAQNFLGSYAQLGLSAEESVKILVNGEDVFPANHCGEPVATYSPSFTRKRFAQWLDTAVFYLSSVSSKSNSNHQFLYNCATTPPKPICEA